MPAFKIKWDEIARYIRKVASTTTCRLAIIDALKIVPVKYPIQRVEMRTFSIPGQITCWTQENIMLDHWHVGFFFS